MPIGGNRGAMRALSRAGGTAGQARKNEAGGGCSVARRFRFENRGPAGRQLAGTEGMRRQGDGVRQGPSTA